MSDQLNRPSTRISIHHVGGRSGSRSFPVLPKFESDLINVLYDADSTCLSQIKKRNEILSSELNVLPYCLGQKCQETTFNLNYDPYTSSLRSLNHKYGSFYSFYGDHDYILSETVRTVETKTVKLVSLDYLAQSGEMTAPLPDFLSIDTQGSEYEILLGARETLASTTVCLVVEVEFHQIYEGQKLFGDLSSLLAESGFEFVCFQYIGEAAPYRAPIGLRGHGFQLFGDALFFRKLDTLKKDNYDTVLKLHKLAFIAILFNQIEYALECLHCSQNSAHLVELDLSLQEHTYGQFLSDIKKAVSKVPSVYPETFAQRYSYEASKSRFDVNTEEQQKGKLQDIQFRTYAATIVQKIPLLYIILKKIWNCYKQLSNYISRTDSEFERVLRFYGLDKQADLLQENRMKQRPYVQKDKT